MPSKINNAKPMDGVSWEQKFSITTGKDDLQCVSGWEGDGARKVEAVYVGSGAITLTNYDGFPIGTLITDTQADKMHMKTAAAGTTGWVSSAAWT